MRARRLALLVLASLAVALAGLGVGLASGARAHAAKTPPLRVHYLGHSSFVLRFSNGVSILTDFGQSRAFGRNSPIYGYGKLRPTIVLISHHDVDHDRGARFRGSRVLAGPNLKKGLKLKGISIRPVATTEGFPGDNTSFVIAYKGFTIVFTGDCLNDISTVASPEEQAFLTKAFPKKIGLLLAPISAVDPFVDKAIEFVELLEPARMIPMHYWDPSVKADFLTRIEARASAGESWTVQRAGGADYAIASLTGSVTPVSVINLDPGPLRK
jgi:L-ascorbate metabolism protein UlaG (beta-lactamase superfamily)